MSLFEALINSVRVSEVSMSSISQSRGAKASRKSTDIPFMFMQSAEI